ncbi:MAG: hypothetical protein ACREOY_03385 [Candidatus Dormibacteraceae bacterium]
MASEPIDVIVQRDRAMQKLRDLTWAFFLWAAGMVAIFSVIAAATIPGQAQGTTNTTPPSDQSNSSASTFTDDGQLHTPVGGSFRSAGNSPPLAVSGGSH